MKIPHMTIEEIADGLSRISRWTSRTVLDKVGARWSVLQHSILCYDVAVARNLPTRTILLALLHDIEETLTGDVPKPYKVPDQASHGDVVRDTMFTQLGVELFYRHHWAPVRLIDDDTRKVEGMILLNPVEWMEWEGLKVPPEDWRDIANAMWRLIGVPPHVAVEDFVSRYQGLVQPTYSLASLVEDAPFIQED